MITLSGHTEEEIQIQEAGIRPGEKLCEELLSAKEKGVNDQVYEKRFFCRECLVVAQDRGGIPCGLLSLVVK